MSKRQLQQRASSFYFAPRKPRTQAEETFFLLREAKHSQKPQIGRKSVLWRNLSFLTPHYF